ncbi:MAG TPA: HigA family addiction module antitoxin [Anaerolineales bacterium]|nr:HigA family addiction module antitoxin [Anaerolineales bacterium]HLO29101.1 HigA family addiction module antitoxin [Anaerolineales bacterium]
MVSKLPPIHPGEILLEEFLEPMGISQYRLAKDISVPPRRINEIVLGKRAITPDTALRLSLYFGLSERFWMNLQTRYDLEVEKDRLQKRLEREVRVYVSTQ